MTIPRPDPGRGPQAWSPPGTLARTSRLLLLFRKRNAESRKKIRESHFLPSGHHYYTVDAIVINIGVGIVSIIGININVVEIVVVIVDVVVDIHHKCYNSSNKVNKVEGI